MKVTKELFTLGMINIPMEATPCRIFIVEDSCIIALHLQKILQDVGYHICGIADTGEKALDEIETAKPDVILMDIHLNGELDGIETFIKIATKQSIPVIYMSAFSDGETIKRAEESGSSGYLLKPYDSIEMITLVQKVLRSFNKPYIPLCLSEDAAY
jgi:CheY-like chemotaxis protein